ncbi:hypothetical protein V6N13_042561 [Hibiscus sabdariffa]
MMAVEIILIQSRALSSFLFCLGRESRQMSASRQMSFLLNSGSFPSELLQYNFFPEGPAAFEFCQEITNQENRADNVYLCLNIAIKGTPNGVKIILNHRASRYLSIDFDKDEIVFKVDDDQIKVESLTKQLDKGKGIAKTPTRTSQERSYTSENTSKGIGQQCP